MFVEHKAFCEFCRKEFLVTFKKRKSRFCSRYCYQKAWNALNGKSIRAARRKWYAANKEFAQKAEAGRAYKWREKAKSELFSLLGNSCVRCGFSDARALQVDHVRGGGNKYGLSSTQNARYAGTRLYIKILKKVFPISDFQLLCANCNWIKRVENKEHPQRIYA